MYLLWGVCCEKGEIGVDLMEWGFDGIDGKDGDV